MKFCLDQKKVAGARRVIFMKKLIAISIVLLLAAGNVSSQQTHHGIGFNLGTNLFFGDYSDIPISASRFMPNVGLYYLYQMSPKLVLKFQAGYGQIKSVLRKVSFETSMIPVEVTGMFSLSGSKNDRFITAGLGLIDFPGHHSSLFSGVFVSGGFGINVVLNSKFSLLSTADYRYTSEDWFNGVAGGLKDGYFSIQSGINYHLGKGKKEFEKKGSEQKYRIIAEIPKIDFSRAKDIAQNDVYQDLEKLHLQLESIEIEIQEKTIRIEEVKTQLAELDSNISGLESQLARQKYYAALNKFKAKNYHEAIEDFENLYEKYPEHRLASNFVYWIGECHFALNEYKLAATAFENVGNFSASNKFDYALFMAGRCYLKMGEGGNAAKKFKELIEHHPQSAQANRASSLIQKGAIPYP